MEKSDTRSDSNQSQSLNLRALALELAVGNARQQREAIRLLGMSKNFAAKDSLLALLADFRKSVRKEAAIALAQLGEPHWKEIISGHSDDFEKLGASKHTMAIAILARAFEIGDFKTRLSVIKGLGELGDSKALQILTSAATSDRIEMRKQALISLAKVGGEHAFQAICALANKDKSVEIRRFAVKASIEYGVQNPNEVWNLMLHALYDENTAVRTDAAGFLSSFSDDNWNRWVQGDASDFARLVESENPEALGVVVQALESGSANVQVHAARALAKSSGKEVYSALAKASSSKNGRLVRVAMDSLRSFEKSPEFEQKLTALGDDSAFEIPTLEHQRIIDNLEQVPIVMEDTGKPEQEKTRSDSDYMRDLTSINLEKRYAAIEWLSEKKNDKVTNSLVKAAAMERDLELFKKLSIILIKRASIEVAKVLLSRVTDPNKEVMKVAITALRALDKRFIPEPLLDFLVKMRNEKTGTSALLLKELGGIDLLEPLLSGSPDQIAKTLKQMEKLHLSSSKRLAIPLLINDEPSIRKAAANFLEKLGDPSWKALVHGDKNDKLRILNSGNPSRFLLPDMLKNLQGEELIKAINQVGDSKVVEAIPILIQLLKHDKENVIFSVCLALGKLNARDAAPSIKPLLESDHWLRRASALMALGMLAQPEYTNDFGKCLKDESFAVRREAIKALALLKSPYATRMIIPMLQDPELEVKREAEASLTALEKTIRSVDHGLAMEITALLGPKVSPILRGNSGGRIPYNPPNRKRNVYNPWQ